MLARAESDYQSLKDIPVLRSAVIVAMSCKGKQSDTLISSVCLPRMINIIYIDLNRFKSITKPARINMVAKMYSENISEQYNFEHLRQIILRDISFIVTDDSFT